ncbi:ABC transport system periplasmic substrate binding protein [hydrothermal vent metagenome]|uniref:ABC transport system periplasmic substrate binding protein n=1 Tax=hydrothermal vent metagenome TaxID=652676 RepID=A0A1W1C0T0_9ZZZZ
MNNKVSYKLIGIFVLVGFAMIVGFSYWLLKPASKDAMQKYIIYFDESVAGLNINAPVKYRGITVGKVINLRINPSNIEEIEATVDILKTTPIKETTVAKLTAQGITGLTYINLTLGANSAPLLKPKKGEKYPVIKSVPSLFKDVEKSLGGLSTQLSGILQKTNKILDASNRHEVHKILLHTATVLEHIDMVFDAKRVKSLQKSMDNLALFSSQLTQLTPKVDAFLSNSIAWEDKMSNSFGSIERSYKGIGVTMDNMALSFANSEKDMKDISINLVPTLDATLLQMQSTMIEFNSLLRAYKRNPSDILFKRTKVKRGPGEK